MEIPKLRMCAGSGNVSKGTACVMATARIIDDLQKGLPIGSSLRGIIDTVWGDAHTNNYTVECVDRSISDLCVALNDAPFWESNEERAAVLSPYIARIMGTEGSNALAERRRCVYAKFDNVDFEMLARANSTTPRCIMLRLLDELIEMKEDDEPRTTSD